MASRNQDVPGKQARKADGEDAVLAKIAEMPGPYREMGERLHSLIVRSAPALQPTLWYGMPAYRKDGKVICFFRADRYMTFGLTEDANLVRESDAHQLLGSAWFLKELDEATEDRLSDIVRTAAK
ncbi:hypothetical protein AOA80_05870 [Methanomassiliicoccales archaeon RumEn M1]|jgi:hypothetical protein|nr:hypothetical protein AOA80_05870 [Methanomassiliicoccales archaeon RumEn M1]